MRRASVVEGFHERIIFPIQRPVFAMGEGRSHPGNHGLAHPPVREVIPDQGVRAGVLGCRDGALRDLDQQTPPRSRSRDQPVEEILSHQVSVNVDTGPKGIAADDFMNGPVVFRDIDVAEANAVEQPVELWLRLHVSIEFRHARKDEHQRPVMGFHQGLESVENCEPVSRLFLPKNVLGFVEVNADDPAELGLPHDDVPDFALRQPGLFAHGKADGLGGCIAEILPGPDAFQHALCEACTTMAT